MQELDNLIEQYKRRLLTLKELISENVGKMKCSRLETKANCYRTIISELQKLKSL